MDYNIDKKEVKIEGDDIFAYYYDSKGNVIAKEYIDSASALNEEFSAYAKDKTFDMKESYR